MNLFTQTCKTCGGIIFGPRLGGKARGQWLGFDDCLPCREKATAERVSARLTTPKRGPEVSA